MTRGHLSVDVAWLLEIYATMELVAKVHGGGTKGEGD